LLNSPSAWNIHAKSIGFPARPPANINGTNAGSRSPSRIAASSRMVRRDGAGHARLHFGALRALPFGQSMLARQMWRSGGSLPTRRAHGIAIGPAAASRASRGGNCLKRREKLTVSIAPRANPARQRNGAYGVNSSRREVRRGSLRHV
jgi:hypothetical protein